MDPPTKALTPVVSSAFSEPKSADSGKPAYADALRGIANLRLPIQRQTTGVLVRLKLKQFFQSAFVSAKGFKNETTAYRPDIDGLRCVAVMSVVLYHFDFVNFSGGFIGVDVFFVISGYLITANVSAEVREGQFSLFHFYARRIRRIFPVLFVVVLATLAASYFIMGVLMRALLNDESLNLDKGMHQLADQIGVSYLPTIDALCSNGPCLAMADSDVPMQFDTSHLTDRGPIFLVKRWLSFYPI